MTRDRDVVGELARMGYGRARRLLVVAGLFLIAAIVVALVVRSVDDVEVVGTLLYIPVFVAFMYFGISGGLAAGVTATAIYVALRLDAIDAVGWGEFGGVVVGRGFGYLLFGAVGGWAASTLELSLDKLDLYDHIDDETGLHNARFLLQDVELERARSSRYQTVFSVSFVDIPSAEIAALSPRRRRQLLQAIGGRIDAGVRTMDRVAHGNDGRVHHLAVVLPETASGGARVFHERLVDGLQELLAAHDVRANIAGRTCTVPGEEGALEAHLDLWREIDAAEHAA